MCVVVAMGMPMAMAVILPGGMSMPAVLRVAVMVSLILGAVVAVIVGASGVVWRVVRHGRQLNGTGPPGE